MLDVEQHVAPIAQIEPLDAGGFADDRSFGGVSQFVSIDDSGVIMFWVTSSLSSASASAAQDLDRGSAVLAAAAGSSSSSSSSSGGHGSSSSGGLAGAADLGRSSWSKVSLLQTRRLQVTSSIPRSVAPSPSSSSSSSSSSSFSQRPKQDSGRSVSGPSDRGSGLQAPRAVLSTLPQDLSTLLVAAPGGSVLKLARFGAAAHPHALKRDERTQFLQILSSGGGGGEEERKSMGGKEVKYFTSVSAMGVRSCCYRPSRSREPEPEPEWAGAQESELSFSVALVLVGRTDGSVDLFRSDCEGPLQSWSLSSSSSSSSSSSCAVVLLRHGRCDDLPALHSPNLTCSALSCPLDRWIPHRPAAFLAVDSAGRLFLFDLLRDAGGPVGTEQLSTETKLSAQMLDVSGARPSSSSSFQYRRDALHIAVASGGSVGPFVRRLNRMTLDRPAGPGTRKSGSRSGGEGKAEGEDAQQKEEEEEELEEERLLLDAMSRFAAKTAMQQFVTTLPAAADMHLK